MLKIFQKFNQKTELKIHFKNGIWMGLRQIIIAFVGLGLSMILTRKLSREVYGQYQYIFSVLDILSVTTLLGFNIAIVKYLAKGFDGDYLKLTKISFRFSLIGSLALIFLSVFYFLGIDFCFIEKCLHIEKNFSLALIFFVSGLFFPFIYVFNNWDFFTQAKSLFNLNAKFQITQNLLSAALLIVASFTFRNNLFILATTHILIISLTNGFFLNKTTKLLENSDQSTDSIKFGWFYTKVGLIGNLAEFVDKFIVGAFLGFNELAVYSIGVTFIRKIFTATKSVISVINPSLSKKKLAAKYYWFLFFSGILGGIFLYLALPWIFGIIYPKRYTESIFLGQLTALFLPFFILSYVYSSQNLLFYEHEENKKYLTYYSIISPAIYLILLCLALKFSPNKLYAITLVLGFRFVLNFLSAVILRKLLIKK